MIMQLSLPTKKYGFYPEALGTLLAIEEENSFHGHLSLLHPADIFTSAIEQFAQSTLLLVRKVNEINSRPISEDHITVHEGNELAHLTQNLYLCADNFLNACRSILRCTSAETNKETTKLLRDFDSQVRIYNNAVSKTINYIKHRHRRIRTIYCTSGTFVVAGYFVEGVVEKGVLGPDPDIHEESDCAISFNRDIPFHIANMFLCAGIVGALGKKAYQIGHPSPPPSHEDQTLQELFEQCAQLQYNFFDDEIDQEDHPRITKRQDGSFMLSISKSNKASNTQPHLQNFRLNFRIAHKYRSFKIPYLARR